MFGKSLVAMFVLNEIIGLRRRQKRVKGRHATQEKTSRPQVGINQF